MSDNNGAAELISSLPQPDDRREKILRDDAVYKSERASFATAYRDGEKTYDQTLLTLTAGALGLSMTFLKDIAKPPVVASALVAWAWLLLGLTIVLLLINMRLANWLYVQFVLIVDEYFTRYNPENNVWAEIRERQNNVRIGLKKKWITFEMSARALVALINNICLALFLVGLLFLGIFAYRNFH